MTDETTQAIEAPEMSAASATSATPANAEESVLTAAAPAAEPAAYTGLKASGVWPLLDRLWLFAAESSTQALVDLVARSTATAALSPTFTASRGFQGASGKYINTGFNPSTADGNYVRDSASYGIWVETADISAGDRPMGNDSAAASEFVVSSPNYFVRCEPRE